MGGGDSHIKRTGGSSYLLRVKKAVLVPLRVFSLKRSTEGAFTIILKLCLIKTHNLAPLRGVKNSMPCPQDRILVPLRGSFQNFPQAPPSFLYWSLPPPRLPIIIVPFRGSTLKGFSLGTLAFLSP